jgi:hypothetical protein
VSDALVPAAITARQVPVVSELIRPTLRSTAWGQLITGGALTVLLVLAVCGRADLWIGEVVDRLRIAMVLLAVGAAGTFDDPTRPHLDSTPVRRAIRQSLRLVVAASVTSGSWAIALVLAEHHPMLGHHRPRGLPLAAVSVEAAGLVALTLAVAAVVGRPRGTPAVLAGAGTALTAPPVVAMWTPLRHAMFPSFQGETDPAWLAAHQRWLAVAVVAAVVVGWALRDPARRPAARRPRDTGAHR